MGSSFRLIKAITRSTARRYREERETGALAEVRFRLQRQHRAGQSHRNVLLVYQGHGYGIFRTSRTTFTVRGTHVHGLRGQASSSRYRLREGQISRPIRSPAVDFRQSSSRPRRGSRGLGESPSARYARSPGLWRASRASLAERVARADALCRCSELTRSKARRALDASSPRRRGPRGSRARLANAQALRREGRAGGLLMVDVVERHLTARSTLRRFISPRASISSEIRRPRESTCLRAESPAGL